MAKCIKYYEGKGFQLAKSNEGYWFTRIRKHHPDYGWQWSAWDLFEIKGIKKSKVSYENTNGNEIFETIVSVYPENEFNCFDLVNAEIEAYRKSNFRLPDINKYKL